MPDLLILSATKMEVAPFLGRYPQTALRSTRAGQAIVSGVVGKRHYDLLITGPGGFNTACALSAYLESLTVTGPGLILQAGIAGVFRQTGLNIGDLAIATSERYIHTGVESKSIKNEPLPFNLIENQLLTCKGLYPFHETRVDHLYQVLCKKKEFQGVKIEKGPLVTVSTITASFDTAEQIHVNFLALMEAMEGAAAAHVAQLYDIPMIEIRAASNFAGDRNKSNWNVDLAVENLGQACKILFDDR